MAEKNGSSHGPHLEVLRVVRLCHPGWEGLTRLTFAPQPMTPSWQAWREEVFLPILLPGLRAMHVASATGNRGELIAHDTALDAALPAMLVGRSRRAGQMLVKTFPAPPAEKLWRHFGCLVEADKAPGHLASILAVRAAAFHIAPPLLISAYIYLEARAGLGAGGVDQWLEMTDDCVRVSVGQGESGLRAA